MKKHYFIYTLLFAYSCSAFAVKPTVKHGQSNHNVQVDASSINDEFNENSDGEVEVPKKPTVLESWRKLVSLELRSLNRDDAWNIGKTVTFAGVGCYLFSHFAKGPNGLNDPNLGHNPHNPFDGDPGQQRQQAHNSLDDFTPEELQQQREALEAFQREQEDGRIAQRMQEELEEVVQREDDFFRQREVQRQEEEAQRELEALEGQLRELEAQRQLRERQEAALRREQEEAQRQQEIQEQVERYRLGQEEAERRIRDREIFQRQRQERQNEFDRWQQEEADELAEAIRQSQLMEDERINNAPVIVIEPVVENLVPEIVVDPTQEAGCEICADTKNIAEFTEMPCCHYSLCTECLMEQLIAGLDTNSSAQIKCPNRDCTTIKIEQPVMQAITMNHQPVLNRYLDITFNEWLIAQEAKQCPTVDCPFRFLSGERPESIVCGACHERYCNHCLLNHDVNNVTCEQARRDRDPNLANQANEQWIRDNTRACGQCNAPVERNQGCNHMTCTQCRHEFCYVCGREWGNLQTCPYYNHPPVMPNNQRNG